MRNCWSICCFLVAVAFVGRSASGQEDLFDKLEKAEGKTAVALANRISAMGIQSPKAQKVLMEKLKSSDLNVRGASVDAIMFVGEPTDEVINAILDSMNTRGTSFPDARPYNELAVDALVKAGPKGIPLAVKRLSTDNRYRYFGLMGYFHRMGPEVKELAPQLVERLEPGNRLWATTFALIGFGKHAKGATDKLIQNLDHKDFNVVCITCRALAAIGPDAKKAKSKLLEVLKDGNISVRGRVMEALGGIGVAADDDVKPLFAENLKAFHQSICDRTMIGIGHLGPEKGKEFIPMVEEAIKSPKYKNKSLGAKTLYKIGGSRELVFKTLKESISNPVMEIDVLDIYGEIGKDAKSELAVVLPYLDSEDDYLRAIAMESIAKIGMDDKTIEKIKQISETGEYLAMRTAKQILKSQQKARD